MKSLIVLLTLPLTMSFTKVPKYLLPKDAKPEYSQAVALIEKWGNSDEFFKFVSGKRSYFAHTNLKPAEALTKFRECMNRGEAIGLVFMPMEKDVIGRWNRIEQLLKQNQDLDLGVVKRAGHIYHETAHFCDFWHLGDELHENDNLNSFPYAVGYDFEDFIKGKI